PLKIFKWHPGMVRKVFFFIRNFVTVFSALRSEKIQPLDFSKAREALHILARAEFLADIIDKDIQEHGSLPVLVYSFWFYDPTFLVFLKKRHPSIKAVCRAHGGDIYEERGSLNKV